MKQLLQSLADGKTMIEEVPIPDVSKGQYLIKTELTLVSAGTERMLVEFGKANLLNKARQQPDKVKEVIAKVKTDGLLSTFDAVKAKLDQPIPLGYCNVGRIFSDETKEFPIGLRVVSNGPHSEFVTSTRNLMSIIPDNVSNETAVFTVIGSIALQGVRLANVNIGETVAVFGLGVIGLLTVQILKAQGCRVLAIDLDDSRLDIAKNYGAEVINTSKQNNLNEIADTFTSGVGFDAVIISASNESDQIISQAAQISRKRGKIILTGVVGLNINRQDFYEKELTFQVSCSYGPGRYDPNYEELGQDYPVGFVRWTEKRNFDAVLELMSEGKICVDELISHKFKFDEADEALSLLTSSEKSIGILLEYKKDFNTLPSELKSVTIRESRSSHTKAEAIVNFIGAGNYANRVLIPAFLKADVTLNTCVSARGVNAAYIGKKYGFLNASSDENAAIADTEANCAVIATQHHLHAEQVLAALEAGKHIFCEKPLCISHAELNKIEKVAKSRPDQILMVGFNRRFSPFIIKAKNLICAESAPKNIIITVNAGFIPKDHWTQDKNIGGGRIIGEACHFIDLSTFLTGEQIISTHVSFAGSIDGLGKISDQASITLNFSGGSVSTIHYLGNGHRSFPKERIEIFVSGKIVSIINFRRMFGFGWSHFKKLKLWRQNKGQVECVEAFVRAVSKGEPAPISFDQVIDVTRKTIQIAEQSYEKD